MSTTSHQFVVVGAGSGGAAVARRLVDEGHSVLVLEAGPADDHADIHDPTGVFRMYHTSLDWDYFTTPQENLAGRRLHWPRGKVLGGSSSTNGMAFVRGNRLDYDGWAQAGAEGWGYDEILPLFKKLEDSDLGESHYHGVGGPVHVKHRYHAHPVHDSLADAAVETGFPFNPDVNAATQDGVSHLPLSIRGLNRESTATAYLNPVKDNPLLEIVTDARVHRVLFAGDRCTGVEYVDAAGETHTALADEVILSAGTMGTTQLLILSGIGHSEELTALGIPVVVHAPEVGKNLHDHVMLPTIFETRQELPPAVPGTSFIHTALFAHSRAGLPSPDLQSVMFHMPVYVDGFTGPENAVTFTGGINRPTSRGALRVVSTDITVAPELDPRYLSTTSDQRTAVENIRINREVMNAPALREWIKREVHPGPDLTSYEDLLDYVARSAITYHHQVGTCRMGSDDHSVVDPQLRVRGVTGLRIADASIIPSVTTGNTNAPAIMIGEKCAELILTALKTAPPQPVHLVNG